MNQAERRTVIERTYASLTERGYRLRGLRSPQKLVELPLDAEREICYTGKNSAVHAPKQIKRFILNNRRRYEADSCLDRQGNFY